MSHGKHAFIMLTLFAVALACVTSPFTLTTALGPGVTIVFFGIGIALLLVSSIYGLVIQSKKAKGLYIPMHDWVKQLDGYKYYYAWSASAIAIDPNRERLLIATDFNNDGKYITKEYKFHDVREWKTENIGHGSTLYIGNGSANALSSMHANSISKSLAQQNLGLTVAVRDIDHPQWFVRFNPNEKNVDMSLARWMEILRQHINKT